MYRTGEVLLKKQILHVSQLGFPPYEDVSYPLNFAQLPFNVLDCNRGVSHGNDILCWKTDRTRTGLFGSDDGIFFFQIHFCFLFKDFMFDCHHQINNKSKEMKYPL